MAVFETWLKNDLQKPVSVKQLPTTLFLGDNESNLIGVEILDGGSAAVMTGDVYGYILRDDDDTIIVQGTLEGNNAFIVLPATAYAITGNISIVIKVGGKTVGACVGRVYRSQSDTIADPDNIIPSVEELLVLINEAIEAGETATEAADTAVEAKDTAVEAAESASQSASEAASAKLLTTSSAISIPSVGTTVMYDMDEITADHQVIQWNFSDSAENKPPCSLSWTTYAGWFQITNDAGTTSESIRPVFAKPVEKVISSHSA